MAVAQPAGTVTLVFTDIEGSTKLLEELGVDAYRDGLAEHRRIVRDAFARHSGYEVNCEGDEFFVAFASAQHAVAAAAAVQQAVAGHDWPDGRVFSTRIGVHTGEPLLAPPKYVGLDVHKAARIMSSAHGGQVVLSRETRALLSSEAFELRDLGEHRLKDLSAPISLTQLLIEGCDDVFPPLRTLYQSNLPVPDTPFLGRERELAEVESMLDESEVSLLTLVGPGGTGKTRLALQAAAEVSDRFPDGVFWVALAPVRDAALLGLAVAQAVEVSAQPDVPLVESVVRVFADKHALMLLDNCEHLADEVAGLARSLVEGCPSLVVLATSRERLRLRAERVYGVPVMGRQDGEALFVERARAVQADFEPDEHVSAICEAVDQLPLAIELAAARVSSLSPATIHARLQERLGFLTSHARDVDERQRTLEATIGWSYDLLGEHERRAFRGLSVFAGGCTLEAAEQVAGADLDLVEGLFGKSLLRHRIDDAGQDRYLMLESIREYASAALTEAGERQQVEHQFRTFFAGLAKRLMPLQFGSGFNSGELARYGADRASFRHSLSLAVASRDANNAMKLIRHLAFHWYDLGELEGMLGVTADVLALDGGDDEDRACVATINGFLSAEQGDLEQARTRYADAEKLAQQSGSTRTLLLVLNSWSFSEAQHGGDARAAIKTAERMVSLAGETDDAFLVSAANRSLANALMGYALTTEPPDRDVLEEVRRLVTESLASVKASEPRLPLREASGLHNLSITLNVLGRPDQALGHLQECIRIYQTLGLRPTQGQVISLGSIAVALGHHRTGVMLTAHIAEELKNEGVVAAVDDRYLQRRDEASARAALTGNGYENAVRDGVALTRDEAIELGLSLLSGSTG